MIDLRILFIEDSENDILLLLRELQKGGYDVEWKRVQTAADMQAALASQPWDLILCDYSMPFLNALEALEILNKSGFDLPCIIVSGSIDEEAAVFALKAGAHDFLSKSNLARLVPAIGRELKEAEARRKHKQVSDSLRASELRFRSTLENLMEGCQIIGYDWRYLYVNDSAVKDSHITRESLLGHTMMECYPGIEDSALFTTLQHCMDERISYNMLNEFIYADGSKGWFELSIQPAPDGIFILSSDVTKRKQAEQALLEREMKLAILLDILPVGISILDAERKVSYSNPALKKMLDISGEELQEGIHGNWKYLRADGSLMPLDERATTRAFKEKIEIDGVETGVVKEDDSIVWTDVSAVPVNFPDWKVVVVTSDITERKQAEEALRESEIKFSVAFHSSPLALFITKLDGEFIEVNRAFCELTGYSNEEIIGNTFVGLGLLSAQDRERLISVLESTHSSISNFEAQLCIRDRSLRDVLYSLETISFRGELHRLSTGMDITERKQAEREILKLNAELEAKIAERTAELAAANERLHQLSLFDELTGLYNRRGFLLLAEEQLSLARRARRNNLLVFYADLDGLKQINDSFGHSAGDQAIVTAARALDETFRTSDIKARLGGDEFIVLAVEADEKIAQTLLARLRERFAEDNQSLSVGMVSFDAQNETSIHDLIARADEAMYSEKRSKPGRHNL